MPVKVKRPPSTPVVKFYNSKLIGSKRVAKSEGRRRSSNERNPPVTLNEPMRSAGMASLLLGAGLPLGGGLNCARFRRPSLKITALANGESMSILLKV